MAAPHLWEHEESELEGWFNPANNIQNEAHVSSMDQYKEMYERSVNDPAGFWGEIASEFHWQVAPDKDNFLDYNFDSRKGKVFVKWMQGAVTNVCYNVLDRNVKDKGLGDTVAFFWEGNDPDDSKQITYGELLKQVCKFSNVLASKGIKKGDRVAIYMPMIVELVVAMLACARIGAIHSIVFAGFSADSLAERILDSSCSALLTADGVYRGAKLINLKAIADEAIEKCSKSGYNVPFCVVVQHLSKTNGTSDIDSSPVAKRPCPSLKISWNKEVDIWWHDLMEDVSDQHEPTWMDAEDPLFMLYTSGSTGKPKGVVHHVGGYMLYTAATFKYVFDYHPGEVYWCSADIGWITGHSYIVYGPMAYGATSVMFEGTPLYPNPARYWAVVDKYKVNKFYTAPTAIRALMKYGPDIVKEYSRKSLTVLGTVGEPINPEAWLWYYHVVGEERCSIVDTFWQTETGGHMLTPLPGATRTRPGSATFPFFGVVPAVLDKDGNELEGPCEGLLAMKQPWPGIMRTLYNNHKRYEDVYFNVFKGYYYTGDGCRRDENGYYWITGRSDDCMNVSGHLLSTTEIENALVEHDKVSEAAVVSYPHSEKGKGIYCFVTLMEGIDYTDELAQELKMKIRKKIGPFASPDVIQNAPSLPKTRSGKIMRRVLRQIAQNSREIGDVSTLADSGVIEQLFNNRPKQINGQK